MIYFDFFKKIKDLNLSGMVELPLYDSKMVDLYERVTRGNSYDMPLYTRIASKVEGPILEIGCGTGRVLIRLAQLGYQVVGIDHSENMLDLLNKKLKDQSAEVRERVSYYKQDFYALDQIQEKYNLAIMPGSTLNDCSSLMEIERLFHLVYDKLNDNGYFIFDYNMWTDKMAKQSGNLKTITWEDEKKVLFLIDEKVEEEYHKIIKNYYAEYIDGQVCTRYLTSTVKQYYSTDQILQLIIDKTKFQVVHTNTFKGKRKNIKFVVLKK